MLLASAHFLPALTIPPAAVVAAWIAWYWFRLGHGDVPPSRRRIRRLSLGLMLLSLPMFVRALSFLDPNQQPQVYVLTWSMALLMILAVIVTALLDAMNNLRLLRQQRRETLRETAGELVRAIQERRRAAPPGGAPSNPSRAAHQDGSAS